MKLWFSRRDRKAAPQSARDQLRKARGGRPRGKKASGPPPDDPIKNWETRDQAFLRQSGDPFLDG